MPKNIMGCVVVMPRYYVAEVVGDKRVRVTQDMMIGDADKAMRRMKEGNYELVEVKAA